mmetsp:Transcript_26524/g.75324  ORF Transcript_26524/g.75324 Transcript_26524/m.75324 type:complete len:207 (-) Transcript_26524:174-794(-)
MREDLDGAQHDLAVLDVARSIPLSVLQVVLEARWEEDRVRVDLHGPLVLPVLPLRREGGPRVQEDPCVVPTSPWCASGAQRADVRRCDRAEGVGVAEDGVSVASEQAAFLGIVVLHQVELAATAQRHQPTQEPLWLRRGRCELDGALAGEVHLGPSASEARMRSSLAELRQHKGNARQRAQPDDRHDAEAAGSKTMAPTDDFASCE